MNDGSGSEPKLNRLANETSPYLLQHKENPVDWYPWGEEAFAEAKRRDVPILVSIGYSTCHWCHVMAHETFEDAQTAQVMNERFVNIKVDREERPDIDAIYLQAVQAMGHQAGWPLNVFLTPDGEPFFGGTYWPKQDRPPMPGFQRVLATISSKWQTDRENLLKGSEEVANYLRASSQATPEKSPVTPSLSSNAVGTLESEFDQTWGGFGGAPKFPQPSVYRFLLRHYRRTGDERALRMVEHTIEKMAEGGIHDQLGGGFARYSVDEKWHVPHFEKMLYDNAQILDLTTSLWLATKDDFYREISEGIVTWLQREMMTEGGGFASALDADTEGVEGKYYIWSAAEVDALLPANQADLIKLHFGIADPGSFEGKTVLSVVKSIEEIAEQSGQEINEVEKTLADAKAAMLAERQKRVAPHRDDKVIAGWNGLMIQALAQAGRAFGKSEWVGMAEKAAGFILDTMHHENGRLSRSWNQGQLRGEGVLEDYSCLAFGLHELYVATANYRWLLASADLVAYAVAHFRHPSEVGFYDTSDSAEQLIARPRDLTDSAIPSGNGMMTEMLYVLGTMLQAEKMIEAANAIVESMSRPIADHPLFMGQYLAAAQYRFESPRELVFAGAPESDGIIAMREAVASRLEPLLIIGYNDPSDPAPANRFPMLADRPVVDDGAAYVCQNFSCLPPVTTGEELEKLLES